MQTFKRYKWTWILLLLALVMAGYLAVNSLNLGKEKLPVIGEVQDFSLENVDGDQITLADTQGKARLVYFFHAMSGCMSYNYVPVIPDTEDSGRRGQLWKRYGVRLHFF